MPRQVTVLVSAGYFAQCLPILQGLGRLLTCRQRQNFPRYWEVEMENSAWPDGPNGPADLRIQECRDGIFFTIRAEIVLPGATPAPWKPMAQSEPPRLGPVAAEKAAKAIHALINANVRSPTQAEIEQVLIGELGQ